MADPATLGISAIMGGISMATSAVGAGVAAEGASAMGAAQASEYQYKAGIALMNRNVQEQNAQWDLDAGDVSREESGLKAKLAISETTARQSASGVDVNTGSATKVRDTQGEVARFDQDVITANASKAAYGARVRGAGDEAEANLDLAAANNARLGAKYAVTSSILGGATSVASKWSQAASTGLFSGNKSPGEIGIFNDGAGSPPTWLPADMVPT